MIVAGLTVSERVLLFCLASNTDWQRAGMTHTTAQQMMIHGLVERERGASSYAMTDQGQAVLGGAAGGALIQQAAGQKKDIGKSP
jgi:hypothetical protein